MQTLEYIHGSLWYLFRKDFVFWLWYNIYKESSFFAFIRINPHPVQLPTRSFSPPLRLSLHVSYSLFLTHEIWHGAPVTSLAYSSTHPPPYCSIVPLHPSLHLSSPPPLLATLASFGSWWGVTALPLSGRESPLTKSVSVCVWVPACV